MLPFSSSDHAVVLLAIDSSGKTIDRLVYVVPSFRMGQAVARDVRNGVVSRAQLAGTYSRDATGDGEQDFEVFLKTEETIRISVIPVSYY